VARFIITTPALRDVDEILRYISEDNPEAALSLYDRLLQLFELLAENPMIGRERPELQEGVGSFPEGSYVIFYRRWARDIAIVRVLRAARDLDAVFD